MRQLASHADVFWGSSRVPVVRGAGTREEALRTSEATGRTRHSLPLPDGSRVSPRFPPHEGADPREVKRF